MIKCRIVLTALLSLIIVLATPLHLLACVDGLEIKAGTVTLNAPVITASSGGTPVTFQFPFDQIPLVFILPSNDNPNPSTIRVKSITTAGFVAGEAEADSEDGITPSTSFTYLAIEPGNYTIGGKQIQAGSVNTDAYYHRNFPGSSFTNITYPTPFTGSAPITITEVQSFINDPSYDFTGGANTLPTLESYSDPSTSTLTTLAVTLMRAETIAPASTIANDETIAYLAVSPGTGTFTADVGGTINFNAFTSSANITQACRNTPHGLSGSPIAIANSATLNGIDGGWIRQCSIDGTNISLKLQEDRANDTETNHAPEAADVLAFSNSFHTDLLPAPSGGRIEINTATTSPQTFGGRSLNFTSVNFSQPFSETPLVFAMPSENGIEEPASVRIKTVSTSGFDIAQVQPEIDSNDDLVGSLGIPRGGLIAEPGAAESMDIDYLAITPKTHELPDGTILRAGTLVTDAFQGSQFSGDSYDTLTFFPLPSDSFDNPPALLLEAQSINSESGLDPLVPSSPWLEPAINQGSITTTTAEVAFDRAQTNSGTVTNETLGFLAAESGLSVDFNAAANKTITLKTLLTSPATINGVDDAPGCDFFTYAGGAFASPPLTVGNMASGNGGDGGWIRRCSNTNSTLGLFVDEDQDLDSERSHGASEQAAFFAFSEAFEWCPAKLQVTKTNQAIRDLVNGTTNPKAIPDSLVQYSVSIENRGAPTLSNNSIVIADQIPPNTSLFVESSALYPEVPFSLNDGVGTPSSGLSLNFTTLDDELDGMEFSDDNGITFDYEPTPDGDGFDSDVTDIRVTLSGGFLGMSNNTDIPTAIFNFSVRVD